jgi:hypothetical protein
MSPLGTYLGAHYVTSTYSNPSDCIAVARPADPSPSRIRRIRTALALHSAGRRGPRSSPTCPRPPEKPYGAPSRTRARWGATIPLGLMADLAIDVRRSP